MTSKKGPPPAAQTVGERLPYPPGAVVAKLSNKELDPGTTGLTDIEERVLRQAGWKPGDPLPDLTGTTVGKRLTEAFGAVRKNAADLQGMTPVPPGTPPIAPPKMRDITELSPAERAEVIAVLQQARQTDEFLRQQGVPDAITTIPGMADAYRTATSLPDELVIVDDTDEPKDGFNPCVREEKSVPAETEDPQPDLSQPAKGLPPMTNIAGTADAVMPHVQCPRCSYFVDQPVAQPTDSDKQLFIQCIMGGQRFEKMYSVFNGKIAFVLRTLLPSESELVLMQLDEDCEKHRVVTHAQYMRYLQDYRLAAGLKVIHREGRAPVQLQPVGDIPYDKEQYKTALPQLTKYVQDNLFVTDHLRHIIGLQWAHFQRLVELMEVRAEDPDFWLAIGNVS